MLKMAMLRRGESMLRKKERRINGKKSGEKTSRKNKQNEGKKRIRVKI